MRVPSKWRKAAAVLAVTALAATACGGDDDDTATGGEPTGEATDGTTGDGGDGGDIATDVGVTEEPCPNPVDDSKGCIYLGILSDLTEGPFAALAVPIVDGQKAFWQRVNEDGGIADRYEVDIDTYTRDNKYNPQEHVARYREIEPSVLALAQTLGTPTTLAAADLMAEDNVLGAPASWWSGWEFNDNIVQSGYNYCIESMNGLDWAMEQRDVATVMAVGYPGDYGGDSAAGVANWAEANSVEFDEGTHIVQTAPNAVAGNQDAPVQAIMNVQPDVIVIATGPLEMAEIVGKVAAAGQESGYAPQFVGSVPTYNPAVLQSEAGPAIQALYRQVAPWGPFGSDTPAHDAMAEALGDGNAPDNDGFTFGWIWSYPVLAVLEAAADAGDLTREGLLAVVESVTVDYEGALPDKSYAGDPNATVVRESLIVAPDPEAPLGASVQEEFFAGPTAEAFEFTEACVAAG